MVSIQKILIENPTEMCDADFPSWNVTNELKMEITAQNQNFAFFFF